MEKNISSKVLLAEFYKAVRGKMPFGTSRKGFPLLIGKSKLRVIIFDLGSDNIVSFGLFIYGTKYSRKSLDVHQSGIVVEDADGIILQSDLTSFEPDFSKLSNTDIAIMVAIQLKAIGYDTYAAKK